MAQTQDVLAALDIGEARIGVAITPPGVSIAQPFSTIQNDDTVIKSIQDVIDSKQISRLVIGNPRNLQGHDTKQTKYVADFVKTLQKHVAIPIHMQDEALTSVKAEEELKNRNMPYEKGDIDALAATYILQDYIEDHHKVAHA